MQGEPPAPLSLAMPSLRRSDLWPFLGILLGGLLLAAGLLLPLVAFFLYAMGVTVVYQNPSSVELWSLAANLLEGLGFLFGFVGIAAALRLPARASPGTRWRDFLAVFLGGILVTAGIVVASAFLAYVVLVGPSASPVLVDVGEIGGRLLQATGFILVFAGMAWTLRARQ